MMKEKYVDIILPLSVGGSYTYRIPEEMAGKVVAGMLVIVQFGKKKLYTGVVRRVHNFGNFRGGIKDISFIQDDLPLVTETQFRLWEWISSYYMCSVGEVCNAALPSGFRLESETRIAPGITVGNPGDLPENERRMLEITLKEPEMTLQKLQKEFPGKDFMYVLRSLLNKGYLLKEEKIRRRIKPKTVKMVRLVPGTGDRAGIEKLMAAMRKAKSKARILSAYLELAGSGTEVSADGIERDVLLKASGVSAAVLLDMVKQGIFELKEKAVNTVSGENPGGAGPVKLTSGQEKALSEIKRSFEDHEVVLLHGVTSGGKTEIYMHLIKEALSRGRQVLYLMPEIVLTAQMVVRLKAVFGSSVAVYHSRYTDSERMQLWRELLLSGVNGTGRLNIILGARSAIFLPFTALGLIIIDEEHENSYKQYDPAPRYNARDTSIMLARFHDARVLMGTATPSIESYYNCEKGKYAKVELNERYQDIKLPEIIIVNTRHEMRKKAMHSHFSDILVKNIAEALENNEQVILFQNRRGYSRYIECPHCGYIPLCKKCDVTMTYHRSGKGLQCHYCGHSEDTPRLCPLCGKPGLVMKGFGTEQIEEELPLLFPGARTGRLDYDTARKRGSYEELLERFAAKEFDILVGTQMVSKGLHFDHVRVVGIMSADSLLNFPDFRSYERSYQQIAQVSGRAGRSSGRGRVIIQTADESHPVLKYVVSNDYLSFYRDQVSERKMFLYPPYSRLIRITLKHGDREMLDNACEKLGVNLRQFFEENLIGPEYPVVDRIKNLYLKSFLIKAARDNRLSALKQSVREEINALLKTPPYRSVQAIIDVDPY